LVSVNPCCARRTKVVNFSLTLCISLKRYKNHLLS
jgi:hypothetical protein